MAQRKLDLEIGVIGLGFWGTALANVIASQGYKVRGWTIAHDVIDKINDENIHPDCFPDLKLASLLSATNNKNDLKNSDIVVLALPSRVLSEVLADFKGIFNPNTIFVSAIKGFDPKTSASPLNLIETHFRSEGVVLSGPSFANDVIRGLPAAIVAASKSADNTNAICKLFEKSCLRVYASSDSVGVELGGALKNIIALACGISDGLNLGDSARAALITRGLAEISRLAVKLGAQERTMFGLSGLGDLAMTASSKQSRNFRAGAFLGRGNSLEDSLSEVGSEVEGITTTPIAKKLADKHGVEMPITDVIYDLLEARVVVQDLKSLLLSRPSRSEFD